MSLYYFSVILSNCILLAAFVYGMYFMRKSKNIQTKWCLMYLGFILGIEISTKVYMFIDTPHGSQPIYSIYIAGECYILLQLLLSAWGRAKKWKVASALIASAVLVESVTMLIVKSDAAAGYGKTISHLLIVCLAATLLLRGLKELEKDNPFLFLYAFLFLYYSTSLFLFMLVNQLNSATVSIWVLNNFLSSLLYSSFVYTFYKLK